MKNVLIINLFFIICSGCISSFNFENDDNEYLLVVDGKITQKNAPHELFLKRSNSYGAALSDPVYGAIVTLHEENGSSESYIEDMDGRYVFYGNNLQPTSGNSYYIEVELPDSKKYRSRSQIMPDLVKPDKIYYEMVKIEEINDLENTVFKRYINIYINTPIIKNDQKYYFNWRVNQAFSLTELRCSPLAQPRRCYITRKHVNDEIKIFSSENLYGGTLEGYRVASIYMSPDWEFNEKHFYNVAQHSITKEAYSYWEAVKKIAQSTGSIFDTPPAPINGNIYNINDPEERVLGFFEVSSVDTIRTYTFAHNLLPFYPKDLCDEQLYRSWSDPACCNCLSIPDSKLERPHYWSYIVNE